MPILDIQQRFRELGRIRAGEQVQAGGVYASGPKKGQPKKRPTKLPRFRLTSPWPPYIEQAAAIFGGEARVWRNEGSGADEYEVTIDATVLPILVPPGVAILDQWYERWSGGGLLNRCDGFRQTLVDAPCRCPKDPEARRDAASKNPPEACKPTTRLKVMIPDLSDVGIWRLESHGFHAAAELGGSAALIEVATRQGVMVPADLLLVAREGSRRPDQPRKKFFVPAISFRGALGPTLDALGMGGTGDVPVVIDRVQPRARLDTGGVPELPAGSTPFDPVPPVEVAGIPPGAPDPLPPARADVSAPDTLPEPGPPLPTETAATPPAAPLEDPEAFEPPAYDPDHGQERSYTPPQLIAMKLGDRGITKRDEKLQIVAAMVGRPISSSKELTTAEARSVLDRLNDEGYGLPRIGPSLTTAEGPTGETDPGPAPPEPEVLRGDVVTTRAPSLPEDYVGRVASLQVEAKTWDPAQWRTYLADRGVKALELFVEAKRVAVELDEAPPRSLENLFDASEDLVGLLVIFVEEKTRARK